ncbi:HAD family phosphatase [Acetobacteraceae bacterium ESL0709]|nr:HAD family phosphatase [Acetobacteraceae bacterium ESL0697]MDF7677623.1 HAD family phosphatase [Acetobacteraceae bacterium ESL0709]
MSDIIDLSGYKFGAIIFDCDNTIAKTSPVHYLAFSSALKKEGYQLPEDWYFERVGISGLDMLGEFRDTCGADFDVNKVSRESAAIFQKNIDKVRAVEPVAQIARDYYGKIPMAVASGGHRPVVEATLQAIGVRSLFPCVVTVEDVKKGKPAPDLFLLAAEQLGVEPRLCLVFEDSDEGIDAAHTAHMQVIDVRNALGPDYLK